MAQAIDWNCRCGGVALSVAAGHASRVVCYCRDCRGYARHLGADDVLDAQGGTDIVQVAPHRIAIRQGADRLQVLRLSERGLLRWHTGCCRTPVANTLATRRIPFASLFLAFAADPGAAGPVLARAFRDQATGPVTAPAGSLARIFWGLLRRTATAAATGQARRTPFFDADGTPVATPLVLDAAERRALDDAPG